MSVKHPDYVQKVYCDDRAQLEKVRYVYPLPEGVKCSERVTRGFITQEGFTTFEFNFDFIPQWMFDTANPWNMVKHYAQLHKDRYEKMFQPV